MSKCDIGVESQGLLEQLSIELQELAGISGAGIGDDKADVEIVSGGVELPDEILPGDIKHDDSMPPTTSRIRLDKRIDLFRFDTSQVTD